ncbi:GTP-binding protein [Hyunsoonleella sp. SJ7]|uniref:GTP-binding protein n=1 Tax=Hyunsoonleella aquatilis TaxID=2762758 RepID=A0A923H982_9FLAO|nr:GTP-binding protein [Hyunsoonleella aquatilis]MBC3757909.1 GTP-binding protein [Hyunsoonleella aquatilis]
MPAKNEIVLRPRFKVELEEDNQSVLQRFENAKKTQTDFTVTRIDNHVFIKYPKKDQHFWSPQLHLEIDEVDKNSSLLHGLFGPNPTIWTMFMFLHFIVATLFLAFGIWAYTNWTLNNEYILQISLMVLMVIIWFALYFGGRIGRDSSKPEMHDLHDFMEKIIAQKKP